MYDFYNESTRLFDCMVDIRRKLHMCPETDRDLAKTADLVEAQLKGNKIIYKRYDNNGIIAEIGKEGGKLVALRADMDALEVEDLKNTDYKSKIPGKMHACGHDVHTAVLTGAAILLKSIEESLKGRVRLIFQPAEETDGGAKDMIEYGCLEGADAIISLHVDENIPVGKVGVKSGVVTAASNPFEIKVMGRGAHGAYPETGIDSILIAAKIVDNLQTIVSREISALDNAVISIGKINGGTALNAICSSLSMEGILRTLGNDLRGFCKERIKNIVESTAKMFNGSAAITFVEGYPSFKNNEELVRQFINIVSQMDQLEHITIQKPSMVVEDFAYYAASVPGLYYKLGCRNEEKGIIHPAHGSYFDVDEECMKIGCAVQCSFAYHFLNDQI